MLLAVEVGVMNPNDRHLNPLKRGAKLLIYASVILRLALLVQLYLLMIPYWLFYSILAGWTLYLVVAIAIAKGIERAYPATLVLSIVTLAVSLPQPEHLSLAEAGLTLASLTFIFGSALQIGVIALVTSTFWVKRRFRNRTTSPGN